jgi:hypothetical protein
LTVASKALTVVCTDPRLLVSPSTVVVRAPSDAFVLARPVVSVPTLAVRSPVVVERPSTVPWRCPWTGVVPGGGRVSH